MAGALLSGPTMRGRSSAIHSSRGRLPRVGIASDIHGSSRVVEPGVWSGGTRTRTEPKAGDRPRSLVTPLKPRQQIATAVQCENASRFRLSASRPGHSAVQRRGLHDLEQAPESGKSAGASRSAWAAKARGAGASALGLEAGSRRMHDARIICTSGLGVGTTKA